MYMPGTSDRCLGVGSNTRAHACTCQGPQTDALGVGSNTRAHACTCLGPQTDVLGVGSNTRAHACAYQGPLTETHPICTIIVKKKHLCHISFWKIILLLTCVRAKQYSRYQSCVHYSYFWQDLIIFCSLWLLLARYYCIMCRP